MRNKPFQRCQVADIGVALVITIIDQDGNVVDVSSASAMSIRILKPDGTSMTPAASFVSDGTDGQIQYVTQSGDLAQFGVYQLQGRVAFGANQLSTRPASFEVVANTPNP